MSKVTIQNITMDDMGVIYSVNGSGHIYEREPVQVDEMPEGKELVQVLIDSDIVQKVVCASCNTEDGSELSVNPLKVNSIHFTDLELQIDHPGYKPLEIYLGKEQVEKLLGALVWFIARAKE